MKVKKYKLTEAKVLAFGKCILFGKCIYEILPIRLLSEICDQNVSLRYFTLEAGSKNFLVSVTRNLMLFVKN